MSKPLRRCLVAAIVASGLAAGPVPAIAAPPVIVSGGWFRFITPETPAGGYMHLHNGTGADTALTGASSPACGMTMLHESINKGGTDRMVHVAAVPVPAGKSVAFAPGGYHIMCMKPHMHPGQHVPVTLTFKGGQSVTSSFTVYGAEGRPDLH
jgi:copper(I)-binding protein